MTTDAQGQEGDDEDYEREPWCKNFDGHKDLHEFCDHHQAMWCRACDRMCPDCVDDPHCPGCGCHLFCDWHDWDCPYGDEDDE